MFKRKAKIIAITFTIFVISLLYMNYNYAKYLNVGLLDNNEVTDWKVAITSDTKDLTETQEISFKVQDSPKVAKGKIAPGLSATATIEIDLNRTKVPVDIEAIIDDTNLYDCFKLTTKLDGENYTPGTIKTIELENCKEFTEENEKKIFLIEVEWVEDEANNELDTFIGSTIDKIKLPITLNVRQHI